MRHEASSLSPTSNGFPTHESPKTGSLKTPLLPPKGQGGYGIPKNKSFFLDESPLKSTRTPVEDRHRVGPVVDLYSIKCIFKDVGSVVNISELYHFVLFVFMTDSIDRSDSFHI